MPPHPMSQKQKPSLGWMPSRRNATGSCMQRSAKTCGKPLNLSCRQERDVRSSVSMMVSAPYCVLKSLYAGKRATERERKRTNVCCCCAKERVSVFWKRLMKTYPINPYYSECAWVPALARRPGLLRTRFALKPLSCVRNVCIAWHRMNSVTSMRMCACCMHSVDRPVSFCIFHLYNAYLHVSNVHTTCIQPSHAYACTRTLTHQHAREDLCGARYGIDFLSSTYVHTQS